MNSPDHNINRAESMDSIPPTLIDFINLAYSKFDQSHGVAHVMRVFEYAHQIIAGENIMMTQTERSELPYVILCHDVLDHKYIHESLDEAAVMDFYTAHMSATSAAKIKHIHKNCSWSKRAYNIPLEAGDWMRKILEDADRLDAIGEDGLRRCIEYTRAHSDNIAQPVCKHIREKLLLIPDNFNFKTSARIAASNNMIAPLLNYLSENEH